MLGIPESDNMSRFSIVAPHMGIDVLQGYVWSFVGIVGQRARRTNFGACTGIIYLALPFEPKECEIFLRSGGIGKAKSGRTWRTDQADCFDTSLLQAADEGEVTEQFEQVFHSAFFWLVRSGRRNDIREPGGAIIVKVLSEVFASLAKSGYKIGSLHTRVTKFMVSGNGPFRLLRWGLVGSASLNIAPEASSRESEPLREAKS